MVSAASEEYLPRAIASTKLSKRRHVKPDFAHKRAGLPIVIYRDGKTVWVSADEIDASGRFIKHP